ncbi:MAG: FkbM family methyltransferase [Rhodocyclaceae bacterium]|nr:FkbM family methyltransferase [Rhodocyclaceae bacterium]
MNSDIFLRSILQIFFSSLHSYEADNYDEFRFSWDGVDRSTMFQNDGHAEYMTFFVNNHRELFSTWLLLRDDQSRNLFIRLILYRLLGHLHFRIFPDEKYQSEKQLLQSAVPYRTGPGRITASGLFGPVEHFENVDFNGGKLKLDCWAANIAYSFLKRMYYLERPGIRVTPEPGDIIIDAGACFGDTAVGFAQSTGATGKVFAFDPLPTHVAVSRHNIEQNGFADRARIFPYAVGAKSLNLDKIVTKDNGASPGFSIVGQESAIPTITIDDFVAREKLPRVDFIKMDIEGSELPALRGATETLKAFRPRLAISLYHRQEDFITLPHYLSGLLTDYDFYLNHYTIHQEETVLYASPRAK